MSDTKVTFRRLSQAKADPSAASEAQYDDREGMCNCPHNQPNRGAFNVNVVIEEGSVTAVLCASCELPCLISDDHELVEGSVPARLTITVEKYSTPIAGDETDYFLVLDAQPYEAGE